MDDAAGMDRMWIVQLPPRYVLPLAGPLGAVLLAAIAVLSVA